MKKVDLLEKLERFIHQISEEYSIEFTYLFGSFATETENKESDIDIAIMFQEKYEGKREVIVKGNIIDRGMKHFQNRIDVVSLHRASPLLKYQIVKNGIVLKESKKRAEFESLTVREYFDFSYYADIYNKAMIKEIQNQS